MAFTNSAELLQDFTLDRRIALAAIRRSAGLKSQDDKAAYLNEGVYKAATQAAKVADPQRRRVIVIQNAPGVLSEPSIEFAVAGRRRPGPSRPSRH